MSLLVDGTEIVRRLTNGRVHLRTNYAVLPVSANCSSNVGLLEFNHMKDPIGPKQWDVELVKEVNCLRSTRAT